MARGCQGGGCQCVLTWFRELRAPTTPSCPPLQQEGSQAAVQASLPIPQPASLSLSHSAVAHILVLHSWPPSGPLKCQDPGCPLQPCPQTSALLVFSGTHLLLYHDFPVLAWGLFPEFPDVLSLSTQPAGSSASQSQLVARSDRKLDLWILVLSFFCVSHCLPLLPKPLSVGCKWSFCRKWIRFINSSQA